MIPFIKFVFPFKFGNYGANGKNVPLREHVAKDRRQGDVFVNMVELLEKIKGVWDQPAK